MGRIIIKMIIGAVCGGIGAGILFVLGFVVEILNLGCAIITCNCDSHDVFDWSGMGGVFLFFVIGGAIIGMFYGIYKVKEDKDKELAEKEAKNSEEARKLRVKWASEVKQKALNVNNTCSRNKSSYRPLVSTAYKANSQMNDIINELTKLAELQGKVDSLAEELSEKGEASL